MLTFPLGVYSQYLTTINCIKLSKREIDIVSCIISGRSAKGIAHFLSISPKTAEAHTYNIMKKLGCSSRESLISLIEKSDKCSILKKYYTILSTQIPFEKYLKDISNLIVNQKQSCLIVCWKAEENIAPFLKQIRNDLTLTGVNTALEVRKEFNSTELLTHDQIEGKRIIYILSEELGSAEVIYILGQATRNTNQKPSNTFFLWLGKQEQLLSELTITNLIDFSENTHYHLSFFKLLKTFLPHTDLESIIKEFEQQGTFISSTSTNIKISQKPLKVNKIFLTKKDGLKRKGWYFLTAIIIAGFFFYYGSMRENLNIFPFLTAPIEPMIVYDPVLPANPILLDRSELITQLDDKFKQQNEIQTVAIIGIGGAGKTTLARCYASQQKANVVWEINAETKESLRKSFEKLAEALVKTETDKKIFRGIQAIAEPTSHSENLVKFVRERLRGLSNWLLIYDNVEAFIDIQPYFPVSLKSWGQGKVILTTRDGNITNNQYVLGGLVLKELTPYQKLDLFMKIRESGAPDSPSNTSTTEVTQFLDKIPSFPLDVSVAASYLNATSLPNATYLESLSKNNKDFITVQENILKGRGGYAKTRYNIITLSFQGIMSVQKDFQDLFLLISFIDSQNIPRNLLNNFKTSAIVDNFILNLKKHSLITIGSSSSSGSTLSLHRSTQEIIRSYLTETLDLQNNKESLSIVTKALENYIDEAIKNTNLKQMKEIEGHCALLLTYRDLLTDEMEGAIKGGLGIINYFYGNNIKAKNFLEEGIIKLNKNPHKNFMRIAFFTGYLGNVVRDLGDYRKGKQYLEKSIAHYEKNYPKDAFMYARFLSCLGVIERFLGNYQAAKKLFEQSITVYDTCNSQLFKGNIGWVCGQLGLLNEKMGYYEKAKVTLEKSLETFRKKWGEAEDHFAIAWGFEHLGPVYVKLGDFKKGQKALREALKIYSLYFPDEVGAPWIEAHLNNNIAQSKELFKKISQMYSSHFHENYIYVAWSFNELASLYMQWKNYEKAKLLLEQCLFIYQKNYGDQHLTSADVFTNLGKLYLFEGKFEVAQNFAEKALTIFQQEKHPDSYLALELLSDLSTKQSLVAKNQGKCQKTENLKHQAVDYLRKALDLLKASYPADSPHKLRIESKIKELGRAT